MRKEFQNTFSVKQEYVDTHLTEDIQKIKESATSDEIRKMKEGWMDQASPEMEPVRNIK